MQITLDISEMRTDALRGIAYAIMMDESRHRGGDMTRSKQAKACVRELENRAYGGDTSELREMIAHLDKMIEKARIKV